MKSLLENTLDAAIAGKVDSEGGTPYLIAKARDYIRKHGREMRISHAKACWIDDFTKELLGVAYVRATEKSYAEAQALLAKQKWPAMDAALSRVIAYQEQANQFTQNKVDYSVQVMTLKNKMPMDWKSPSDYNSAPADYNSGITRI